MRRPGRDKPEPDQNPSPTTAAQAFDHPLRQPNLGSCDRGQWLVHSLPVTEPAANPPIRLIARKMRQTLFDTVRDWKQVFDGNLSLGAVGLAVWVANIEYSLKEPELLRASRRDGLSHDRFKPIIASHVATASAFDDETARRHLRTLVDAGFVDRTDEGYLLSRAFLRSPVCEQLIDRSTIRVVEMFRHLNQFEVVRDYLRTFSSQYDFLATDDLELKLREIRHLLHTIFMRYASKFTIERYLTIDESKLVAFIGLGVFLENVRDLMADPVLSLQYARFEPLPPASLRTPVSLRHLAGVLDVPAETVRRHLVQLEQTGFVTNTGKGYLVPGESLMFYDMGVAQASAVARLGADVNQALVDLDTVS